MRLALSFLRLLPPEISHFIALHALKILYKANLVSFLFPNDNFSESFQFKGLTFKNRLGIAAGLDKNGDFLDSLGALGFGFIEVGTITPKPQPGNPRPRVFRFTDQEAIINRLGFNNKGVDYLVQRVREENIMGFLELILEQTRIL